MHYQLFQYPLPGPPELEDLNAYVASKRVVSVVQHLVQSPGGAMLVFVVQSVGSGGKSGGTPGRKIDYKDELSEADFAVFSRLRDERKRMAEAESVPVYTIFTNDQLAEMVKRKATTLAEIATIEGVGKARVEKYGPRLVALLAQPTMTIKP